MNTSTRAAHVAALMDHCAILLERARDVLDELGLHRGRQEADEAADLVARLSEVSGSLNFMDIDWRDIEIMKGDLASIRDALTRVEQQVRLSMDVARGAMPDRLSAQGSVGA